MSNYLLVALLPIGLLFAWFAGQHWRQRQRLNALSALLDGADLLEKLLQDCRDRIQKIQSFLGKLPSDIATQARQTLHTEDAVQLALKDLLAHRMWIQKHAETATSVEIDAARQAMARSAQQLSMQLKRLDMAGEELKLAYHDALYTAQIQNQSELADGKNIPTKH